GVDPFWFQLETRLFPDFDVEDQKSQRNLADAVDGMIADLSNLYKKHGIDDRPFVFLKNNSGTYGLAVTSVNSGSDVLEWGYRQRKRLKAAKGGRDVKELIIQEGVPTDLTHQGAVAEPVVYMVGCQTVGLFYRYHPERSHKESLNAPGSFFEKKLVSELSTLEHWVCRAGLIALGLEAHAMGISFKKD
ncbi:MAG: glutamate--cysteine ligase, partial [Bdellovibrionaceae bacterium]|nr:glutamate--cysteine ligase [Pseudobdellovibrionaceae bacterium]